MEAAIAGSVEGALKSTVGKLGSFLWNEALHVSSVREDIQFIRDELQSMDGFLQDMIVSGHLNNQMKVWMLHVLEVACDAELCIDKFNYTLGNRRGHGIVSYARRSVRFVRTALPRYRIAKRIQMLKNRAKEVSERRSRYTTESKTQDKEAKNNTTGSTTEAYSHLIRYNHLIAEDALLGMGSWAPDRLNPAPRPATRASGSTNTKGGNLQVTSSGHECTVLAIVGPTGSGKTALAKMLYRRRNELYNPTMRSAWVTLSPKPDIPRVLMDILRQISNKRDSKFEDDDGDEKKLRSKVKKALQEHSRFLIIFDSLRSKDDWNKIKSVLPQDGLDHGRVVVTTRSMEVAKACCSVHVKLIHPLQPISKDLHNKLTDTLFFGRPWPSNFHHEEARPAVNYCCSIPLALKSICGVLSGAEMDIRMINQFGIEVAAIMVQNIKTDDKVAQVVKLCCNYLPPPLQQCSKDLSILPEGYIIKRKRLTRRWIAKGLISSTGGLSTELVAESYFDELISRCILEPETVCPTGKIKCCLINGVFKECIPTLSNTANQSDSQQVPNPDSTFQLYDIHPSRMLNYVREKLPSTNPKTLTVLDLEGCNGLRKQDLNDLCKFIKLKFLSLRNTDASHLPRNIGELTLLETLDIRYTKIPKVPKGILKLRNLKHFLAGYSYKPENSESTADHIHLFPNKVVVPRGIEDLGALETLAHVNATEASQLVHVVHYMKKLRKLGLVITENKLNSRPLCISLMMMSSSLRSLLIHDERPTSSLEFLIFLCFPPQWLENLSLRGYLGRLPNWVADHKHLSKLTLSETHLSSDAISLLGKINSLLYLKLYPNSLKEHVLTLGKDEFPHLKVLVVHCSIIQVIRFENGTTYASLTIEEEKSTVSASSTKEEEKGTTSASSPKEEEKGVASTSTPNKKEKGAAPELEVFEWILNKNQMVKLEGIENLPMIKQVSLIGDANPIISHEINYVVKKHPNRTEKSLVFENAMRDISQHTNEFKSERHGIISKLAALPKNVKACFK